MEVVCKTWNVEWNGTWNGMEYGMEWNMEWNDNNAYYSVSS